MLKDSLITREPDSTPNKNYYMEQTSSGRLFHYFSNHPLSHKINTIKNVFFSSRILSSSQYFTAHENNYLNTPISRNMISLTS